jgi:hypothetical protein
MKVLKHGLVLETDYKFESRKYTQSNHHVYKRYSLRIGYVSSHKENLPLAECRSDKG